VAVDLDLVVDQNARDEDAKARYHLKGKAPEAGMLITHNCGVAATLRATALAYAATIAPSRPPCPAAAAAVLHRVDGAPPASFAFLPVSVMRATPAAHAHCRCAQRCAHCRRRWRCDVAAAALAVAADARGVAAAARYYAKSTLPAPPRAAVPAAKKGKKATKDKPPDTRPLPPNPKRNPNMTTPEKRTLVTLRLEPKVQGLIDNKIDKVEDVWRTHILPRYHASYPDVIRDIRTLQKVFTNATTHFRKYKLLCKLAGKSGASRDDLDAIPVPKMADLFEKHGYGNRPSIVPQGLQEGCFGAADETEVNDDDDIVSFINAVPRATGPSTAPAPLATASGAAGPSRTSAPQGTTSPSAPSVADDGAQPSVFPTRICYAHNHCSSTPLQHAQCLSWCASAQSHSHVLQSW